MNMLLLILIQVALFIAVLVPVVYFTMKLVRRERDIPVDRGEGAAVARGRAATSPGASLG